MRVRYSPLHDQFKDYKKIINDIENLVLSGEFTLGKVVNDFEIEFARLLGVKYAIGVGSGTDALKIALRASGIGLGDEVITAANTFWATIGAIVELGAKPILVDCDDNFNIDLEKVEEAISSKTRAIVPVHLTGDVVNMPEINRIAKKYNLVVVEDACQSLLGKWEDQFAGTFGLASAFSMHPLKIINVWGDAGIVVTNNDNINNMCRLLRNHGLQNRDEMIICGYNSRLDSIQAVVGINMIKHVPVWVKKRIDNALFYDQELSNIKGIKIPQRNYNTRNVYLLYILFAEKRDELLKYCIDNGIEAKIHYPIPLYRQRALSYLDYKAGSFPKTDDHALRMITLPVDQYLSSDQLNYVVKVIKSFYS